MAAIEKSPTELLQLKRGRGGVVVEGKGSRMETEEGNLNSQLTNV